LLKKFILIAKVRKLFLLLKFYFSIVESSTPVIRKASALSSLIQSNKSVFLFLLYIFFTSGFFGTDSDDDEEKDTQSTVDTTTIEKSPIRTTPSKQKNDKSGE
jgi:hypothetical protein